MTTYDVLVLSDAYFEVEASDLKEAREIALRKISLAVTEHIDLYEIEHLERLNEQKARWDMLNKKVAA